MPKLKKLKKVSLLFLLLPGVLYASITLKNTPIPGGIAVVDFTSTNPRPQAFYNTRPLYVQHIKNQHWQVLIGIPLGEKIGKKSFVIKDSTRRIFDFEVKAHPYTEQHITLKADKKKYLSPNLPEIERINQERPILGKARKTFSPTILSSGFFIRPVAGITTSPFGLKRFYNGKPKNPHTGLDYAGDIGTPIKAATAGKVILIGNFFFNGNTVFIDHGQGLISAYIHMNKTLVKHGQQLKQGDIIGTIGQTGRATGAHLHWGVYLNQSAVNPNLLLRASDGI